jgi:hypothetical protein
MHTIVMSLLFSKGPFLRELKRIIILSLKHGGRLGCFVLIYKTTLLILEMIEKRKKDYHSFIGGIIGAIFVFRNTKDPIT